MHLLNTHSPCTLVCANSFPSPNDQNGTLLIYFFCCTTLHCTCGIPPPNRNGLALAEQVQLGLACKSILHGLNSIVPDGQVTVIAPPFIGFQGCGSGYLTTRRRKPL